MIFLLDMMISVELAVGNVVRRVLHIIREEDLSLATAAMAGLDLLDGSDDDGEDDNCKGVGYSAMSAAVAAAAARSTLRPPSLQTLLEGTPESAAVPYTSSSGADSESKSKCTFLHGCVSSLQVLFFFLSVELFAAWFSYSLDAYGFLLELSKTGTLI